MKPLVYVAGPYSADEPASVEKNVAQAIRCGDEIATQMSANVIIPHLSHFWDVLLPHDYAFWMNHTMAMLERCDAMFVIAMSPGVSSEINLATQLGIPVFNDIEELRAWCDEQKRSDDTVLDRAAKVVYGDRNRDYGDPEDNFADVAATWSAALGWPCTAEDVGLAMILMKVVRHRHRAKEDNLVDIAGYAECLSRLG